MSEIDFLAKQLEYCLAVGYCEPAKELVRELIAHRANIGFELTMNFKCVSHDFNFKEDFTHNDFRKFYVFENCLHAVCWNCIAHYIGTIFSKVGLQYRYICPGCSVTSSGNPTPLDPSQPYFTWVVSLEAQHLWNEQNNILTMTIRQTTAQIVHKSLCYFFNNKEARIDCSGVAQTVTMPSCRHKVCTDCIEKSLTSSYEHPPFKCFVPSCNLQLQDLFIKGLLIPKSQNMLKILRNLRIDGKSNFNCPSCHCIIEAENYVVEIKCHQCGTDLCAGCGKYNHGDFPCGIAELNEKKYQTIECKDNDPINEYRSYYYQACALFEWDLEPKKKAALMAGHNIKFKVKKVVKIVNPKLQELYDKHKSEIRKKGLDPDEKWVFHGTQDQFYDEICRNGFKIGGVDVNVKIGQAFGFGLYTATDPTMSVAFYNNKKIILCKGLTGNKSNSTITNKEEFLKNTQYHSYFADFRSNQSNYYIFFNKEYVLPFFYIEYE